MPQRYGDFATWTGALGTMGAFAVGFYQIHRERTFRKKRELREWWAAKREHADRVTAWVSSTGELVLSNGSHHLVHDVVVVFDGGRRLTVVHAEPGRTELPAPDGCVPGAVASIEFTDPRGDRWIRQGAQPPHLVSGDSAPEKA